MKTICDSLHTNCRDIYPKKSTHACMGDSHGFGGEGPGGGGVSCACASFQSVGCASQPFPRCLV